jgi:hypothetical protein
MPEHRPQRPHRASDARDRASLSGTVAQRFAERALDNLAREYPHKLDHVLASDADACPPRSLHPAFHGSFDWHSCVHMHWLLARIRHRFPQLPSCRSIDAWFDRHLTTEAIAGEVAYLARPGSATFERPYGWAWLLKLTVELHDIARRTDLGIAVPEAIDDPAERTHARWLHALQPLADAFAARYRDFLPRTRYPVRHGVHANSAFGLAFAIDYAHAARDPALASICAAKARDWYANDRDAPAAWEPSGSDFLSPALIEAELMRRVLDRQGFGDWLAQFLPRFAEEEPHCLFVPADVGDRSDAQLVHLDGLNLSRAWCLRGIAASLPAGDARVTIAQQAADAHLAAGWLGLESEDFVGAHWLASFALLALDA